MSRACLLPQAGLVAALLLACACVTARPSRDAGAEVRAVLDLQAAEWNRGSVDGFMRGYANSPDTRFASGGEVTMGWQTVGDRYKRRYSDAAKMGHLVFDQVDVKILAPDAAVVFGHWHLRRAADAPEGLFTLVFRRGPDGWRVVHDHTSAATP